MRKLKIKAGRLVHLNDEKMSKYTNSSQKYI